MTTTTGEPAATGVQSTLSEWAGPYTVDMLGKGWALANSPYEAYEGQLTAGYSPLHDDAFSGLAGMAVPEYDSYYNSPDTYNATAIDTGTWNNDYAQQYMNPYLQSALDPMMEEARRQAQITRLGDAGRLSKAGAFGGSRQAIMESELNRNLMDKQNQMLTQGYTTAYDKALNAFNQDQTRTLQADTTNERNLQVEGSQNLTDAANAAQYGISGINTNMNTYSSLIDAANVDRGIQSEAIAADYAQWQQEQEDPYKKLQFQQSLLNGLPIAARDTNFQDLTMLQEVIGSAGGLSELFEMLFGNQGSAD